MTDWLDGPKLVEWLKENGLKRIDELQPINARAVRRWKKTGTKANIYSADRVLTEIERHLPELPDELWTTDPNRQAVRKITPEQRLEIFERAEAGEPVKLIAESFGIDPRAVRYHRDKARMYAQTAEGKDKRRIAAAA